MSGLFAAALKPGTVSGLNSLVCSLNVGVLVKNGIGVSDPLVQVVEIWGLSAWDGFQGPGAGHRELVKNGLVSAEEAVMLGFTGSVSVGDRVAHMENLAIVGNVSVVTSMGGLGTSEGLLNTSHNELNSVGEHIGLPLHPGDGNGDGHEGDSGDQ